MEGNEAAKLFKPEPITVKLGDKEYRLVYDLNALCELEKIYGSVATILQMILGTGEVGDYTKITYCGAPCKAEDIVIDGTPLTVFLEKQAKVKTAGYEDTRNLLWAGCLYDHAIFDKHDEIVGYSISKTRLGREIGFHNIQDINQQILVAFLRDMVPPGEQEKNVEVPVEQDQ
jgi:hypothetical protein